MTLLFSLADLLLLIIVLLMLGVAITQSRRISVAHKRMDQHWERMDVLAARINLLEGLKEVEDLDTHMRQCSGCSYCAPEEDEG